jgi:hypothetical protein
MTSAEPGMGVRVFAQLDLVLLAAALPVFLVLNLPLAGYVVAAAAWLIQRFARAAADRRIKQGGEARTIALLTAATLVAPIWFMSLAVLIVGLVAGREDGLAAALITITLFTVNLPARMLMKRAAAQPDSEAGA